MSQACPAAPSYPLASTPHQAVCVFFPIAALPWTFGRGCRNRDADFSVGIGVVVVAFAP